VMRECAEWVGQGLQKKKGQGLVEYVFLISLIALAVVFALQALGLQLTGFLTSVSEGLKLGE
jgi:Flp pilus assembly pilin Flp